MTRTDAHRPGAIVPAAYQYLWSYFTGSDSEDGRMESYNTHEVQALCEGKRVFGGLGKCGVCGASFRYGDLWEHENGELLHIGHDCAAKYQLLANRSAFDAAKSAMERNHKARLDAETNRIHRDAFLAKHPGLAEALDTDHYISRDLSQKLTQYHELSEKQIALAFKLADDAATKPKPEAEKLVSAPTSEKRVTFVGTVVLVKSYEGAFGISYKATIKVETPEGNWLAWGTIPSSVLHAAPDGEKGRMYSIRGMKAQITATLKPGREPHFATMVRPSGKLLGVEGESK